MTVDIDKLKALALALDGVRWNEPTQEYTDAGVRYREIKTAAGDVVIGECGPSEDEAQFIAASCPATVLELIAENKRLRVDAERYRILRAHINPGDVQLAMTRLPPKGQTPEQRIDMLCDLYAGAHSQAGKEPA